ncbi:MAG: site-2 protease family protein [Planctomycetota bacterium]
MIEVHRDSCQLPLTGVRYFPGRQMFLQTPNSTPYDWNFSLFGFPIRVSAWFWAGAAFFGWGLVQLADRRFGAETLGVLPLLVMWCCGLLVSITIHELGHSLAMKRYGTNSSIVLYQFGGLAIPNRQLRSLSPMQDVLVAAAGPVFQILSAVILLVVVQTLGFGAKAAVDGRVFPMYLPLLEVPQVVLEGEPLPSVNLLVIIEFYVIPSIIWGLFNLLPVFPLDGGRIVDGMIRHFGGSRYRATQVSLVVAILVALWGMQSHNYYLGIMFGLLAFNNYQTLEGRFP